MGEERGDEVERRAKCTKDNPTPTIIAPTQKDILVDSDFFANTDTAAVCPRDAHFRTLPCAPPHRLPFISYRFTRPTLFFFLSLTSRSALLYCGWCLGVDRRRRWTVSLASALSAPSVAVLVVNAGDGGPLASAMSWLTHWYATESTTVTGEKQRKTQQGNGRNRRRV